MSELEKIARERNMTAKEAAKRFNKSPRSIRRLVALDRDEYLKRAAERRQKAFDMRSVGYSWREVADAVGTTYGGARSLYYQQTRRLKAQQQTNRNPDIPDMFPE